MQYFYYEVAMFGKPDFLLTYKSQKIISPGTLIFVPIAKREALGIVWKKVQSPSFKGAISEIKEITSKRPLLTEEDIKFFNFCAHYYHTTVSQVLKTAIPQKAQNITDTAKEQPEIQSYSCVADNLQLTPNREQKSFIDKVQLMSFKTYLLHGVTGSGKTFCYSELIKKILQNSKNILVLVPEISLVDNMVNQLLRLSIGNIISYHSQISADQKAAIFTHCNQLQGHVIVSTRSGIFLPIRNIGLIIVDEEHDSSFKEENKSEKYFGFNKAFFYHARDLAVKKSQLQNCPCILGSATPSLQSLHNAQKKNFAYDQLLERATEQTIPKIELVRTVKPTWKNPLDPKILLQIKSTLDKNRQVLIYLNQRGYIPNLYCTNCKKSLTCPQCSSKVVVHEDLQKAHCHHCCTKISYDPSCPQCGEPWVYCGFGTQRLKEYLQEVFPLQKITMIDTDHMTTSKKLFRTLKDVENDTTGLVVGTQMVCKGHNWPNITLSIILVGHYQLDHQIDERVAQNIVQVAGRAGRFQAGRAIIPFPSENTVSQTLKPLLEGNYYEWIKRYNISLGEVSNYKYAKVHIQTQKLQECLKLITSKLLSLSDDIDGPMLDYPSHIGKYWKVFINIASKTHKDRHRVAGLVLEALKKYPKIIKSITLDIDPTQREYL